MNLQFDYASEHLLTNCRGMNPNVEYEDLVEFRKWGTRNKDSDSSQKQEIGMRHGAESIRHSQGKIGLHVSLMRSQQGYVTEYKV